MFTTMPRKRNKGTEMLGYLLKDTQLSETELKHHLFPVLFDTEIMPGSKTKLPPMAAANGLTSPAMLHLAASSLVLENVEI